VKKLLERFHLKSDRAKLLLSFCGAALVLIAAMLLPLGFRTAPGTDRDPAAMTLEERTRMFADYWTGGAEAGGYLVEKPDPVPRKMRETCETVARTLIARAIDDRALTDATPTGSEYTVVSDGTGRELKLCRMWLERRGDWQNWLDVCMDAETGEVYYFYLSRECLTNQRSYSLPEQAGAAQIAESLATENGWSLRHLAEESGGAVAVYSSAGGTLCYTISSRLYDALIDVKITCG